MDALTRRTLARLGAAYAFGWAGTSMVAGPGSAALVALTRNLSFAGLFVALFYVAAAAGAGLGGRAMDRFGRKPPLIAAYSVAAAGYVVAGLGASGERLDWFLTGTVALAAAAGTTNLTRVAAAEMFIAAERGRGVAWVQIAAIFGAVVGPVLLLLSEPLGVALGQAPLNLVWFLAPPLQIAAAYLVSRAAEPRSIAERVRLLDARSIPAPERAASSAPRLILAGTVSLVASQGAMAAVMGVAGAAVSHAGHGVSVLGTLMFLHFVGMFGLSRVVGRLADHVGRRPTILTGLGLLAMGGGVVALFPGPAGFGAGLLLVGLGWSFGYIGGTVLMTDASAPERRARTLGRADLAAQLCAAAIATAGGWWFAARGLAALGLAAMVVALLPVLLVATLRESTPGAFQAR
jgi:MFS family permease